MYIAENNGSMAEVHSYHNLSAEIADKVYYRQYIGRIKIKAQYAPLFNSGHSLQLRLNFNMFQLQPFAAICSDTVGQFEIIIQFLPVRRNNLG